MMHRMTLLLAIWLSGYGAAAQAAAQITLAAAGDAPTAEQCAGIAKINSESLAAANRTHTACLDTNGGNKSSFREGNPCSRAECRDLHMQMHWVQTESARINRDCRSRVVSSKKLEDNQREQDEQAQSKERERLFLKMDELHDKGIELVGWVDKLDNPVKAVSDWLRGRIKNEFDDILFGGKATKTQKEDLEWDIFRLFHNRSVETLKELHSRSPVIGAIIGESHGYLADQFETVRDGITAFDDVARDISLTLPNANPAGIVRVANRSAPARPAAPAEAAPPAPEPATNPDCAIFKDSDRSMAFLLRQPEQWNVLNARCGKRSP